jgi:hypothetical protein
MTEPTTPSTGLNLGGFNISKRLIAAVSVLLVALLFAIIAISTFSSTRSAMIRQENNLSQEYTTARGNLATYVSTIREALGVADRATGNLDALLTDVVAGRYQGDTSVQPGGGQLFSAITEAYPDITSLSINYERVQTAIFAGRESFKNEQEHLLQMISDYSTWREDGLLRSFFTGMLGAPTDRLKADNGTDIAYGQAALDRMAKIVSTQEANDAYKTGVMEPLDLGPTTAPASPSN